MNFEIAIALAVINHLKIHIISKFHLPFMTGRLLSGLAVGLLSPKAAAAVLAKVGCAEF